MTEEPKKRRPRPYFRWTAKADDELRQFWELDLTMREVARAMEISEKSVKARLATLRGQGDKRFPKRSPRSGNWS